MSRAVRAGGEDVLIPQLERRAALVLDGVTAGYGRSQPVLRELDLSVPEGACWAICGPSGGGKTTLLRVALGLVRPACGEVRCPLRTGLDGASRGAIGYIPQNLGLVRNRSVRDNVLLGALSRISWWRTLVGRFPRAERQRADEALQQVGLGGRGSERIEALSGGERRRVAIARALLQKPDLLVADEFLAELDAVTAEEIIGLLQQLRESTGMTVLFVEHDVETACRIAERVVVIVNGRKVRELDADAAEPASIKNLFRAPPLAAPVGSMS